VPTLYPLIKNFGFSVAFVGYTTMQQVTAAWAYSILHSSIPKIVEISFSEKTKTHDQTLATHNTNQKMPYMFRKSLKQF
jgi:hypothetical protein